jgi:sulfatase maturation enzyme AslB (radical SAM superfamily)
LADFFCPLPFKGLFVHTDKVAVCCASVKPIKNITPNDFLNSDYLKNLREKFLAGEIDESCSFCVQAEAKGLQSIRQHTLKSLGYDTTPKVEYMELRASNLCNFSCKMCNGSNSSSISGVVENMTDESWQQVLSNTKDLKSVSLTGGEPFLIKQYHELLDHLIATGKEDINMRIYTNCSVYNKKFLDKLEHFKSCELHMSIDGVGKTAELQRAGSDWTVVDENVRRFMDLKIGLAFHTTFTKMNLLSVDKLAAYFVEMQQKRPDLKFIAHTIFTPSDLTVEQTPESYRQFVIASIDRAIDILQDDAFSQLRNELTNNKRKLTV